jgi:uncharacterized membrane protein YhhN
MKAIAFASQRSFILFVVFISLFAVASLFNLYAGFVEHEKLRRISKPFCLLFLALAALFASPTSYLIYIGALLGALGDLLLIWKDNKACLLSGLISFLGGHICYIAMGLTFLASEGKLQGLSFLYLGLGYLGIFLLSIYPVHKATKGSKMFTIGGSFYSSILISVLATGILGMALGYSGYFLLMTIGAAFFIASDCTLTFTIFHHDIPRRDFYIMLTYLIGQCGIVLGLLFTIL